MKRSLTNDNAGFKVTILCLHILKDKTVAALNLRKQQWEIPSCGLEHQTLLFSYVTQQNSV